MVKVGKWIAKQRVLILLIGFLLIIPSIIGMAKTRVNYDLLSYLPEHLETVKGQDILVDEYGMGAFSMVVVEDTDLKDVQKLEEKFEKVDHVKDVLGLPLLLPPLRWHRHWSEPLHPAFHPRYHLPHYHCS